MFVCLPSASSSSSSPSSHSLSFRCLSFSVCSVVCSVVGCISLLLSFTSRSLSTTTTAAAVFPELPLSAIEQSPSPSPSLAFSLYLCPNNNNIITPTSSKPRLQKRFAPITLHKLRSLQKVVECSAIAAAATTNCDQRLNPNTAYKLLKLLNHQKIRKSSDALISFCW